jgi:hypothetical protein
MFLVYVLVFHSMAALHWKLNMAKLMRTSAPLLGTPSVQSIHDYYPFAMEDGGKLAPMTDWRMSWLID